MGETPVGRISDLQCFPVKSMLGQRLATCEFDSRGMRYDRWWALRGDKGKLGSGKNARRFQRISALASSWARCEAGVLVVTLPDGSECRGDDPRAAEVMSAALGEPVTLHQEDREQHFDDSPVHVATLLGLRQLEEASGVAVDPRRLRANVLIAPPDGPAPTGIAAHEADWPGHLVLLGPEVVLEIIEPMERCVMINQATAELPADHRILKALGAQNAMALGSCARVVRPGRVAVGDAVRLAPGPPPDPPPEAPSAG